MALSSASSPRRLATAGVRPYAGRPCQAELALLPPWQGCWAPWLGTQAAIPGGSSALGSYSHRAHRWLSHTRLAVRTPRPPAVPPPGPVDAPSQVAPRGTSSALSSTPSTLVLLIIGEQIFPQIIRQFKSYNLSLRTIFNPDLNVIYTSRLPEAALGAKTWIKYFLNVKCCLIVDCTEFICTDKYLIFHIFLLPK